MDIGDIEVSVAGLSSEEPGQHSLSETTILWAARECLSFYSMAPYGGDIELKKNKYGLPYLCLSEGLSTRVRENGISRVLISSTNDSGVAFGIAAATKVSENSSTESLGIGIDLLFRSTAEVLFTDCTPGVLEQIFTRSELNEAYMQPDERACSDMLMTAVVLKEAAFKAVSEAYRNSDARLQTENEARTVSFLDVETYGAGGETPSVALVGALAKIARLSGVTEIHTAAVRESPYSGAVALALGKSYL